MIVLLFKILFMLTCLALIGIILIQRARGGGLAGAFGGAGSDSFIGNLQNKEIVRWTTYLAAAFFFFAVSIDFLPQNRGNRGVEELSGVAPTSASVPVGDETSQDADFQPIEVDEDLPTTGGAPADNAAEGQ